MADVPVYIMPPVKELPTNDPLRVRAGALAAALNSFGLVGQADGNVGSFAAPVGVYESLAPLQALALARMERLLSERNSLGLPNAAVTWYRDPLNSDPLQSIGPLALSRLQRAVFEDALGGRAGSISTRKAVVDALVALTTQLAPPETTAVTECRATVEVDGKPGRVSSWTFVSAADSKYVSLYITSFSENPAAGADPA